MTAVGTTMQQEAITDAIFDESAALISQHWEECALWKDKVALNPDRKRYFALYKLGFAKLFTLREDGSLIAYLLVLPMPHLHYSEDVFASVDVLFLHPDKRHGAIALTFMQWVEGQVKALGASVMTYHVKAHQDKPALFARLGYAPIESIYAKCLKD